MNDATTVKSLTTIRRALESYGIVAVVAASITLNVLQSQKLRGMTRVPEAGPRAGAVVPPIEVTASDATPARFEYGGTMPTLLYYFSPSCSWCERNWEAVRALERATRGRYRFLAVTTAGDDERRARAPGLPVATYWGWSDEGRRAYRLGGTPHTMVVAPDGRVVRSWAGAYARDAREQLERYFQVRLPELPLRVLRNPGSND